MKFRLMFGALAAFSFLVGEFGLSNVAIARDETLSATPISAVSKEDIERIVDQRLEEILSRTPQNTPPTDFEQMPEPGLGQTSQTQQRIQQGSNEVMTGGNILQGGRTIYAKPFVRAPKTILGGYIDFIITDSRLQRRIGI